MTLLISPVEPEDVDLLVRKVEFPAHQNGLLYRFMFPLSMKEHSKQREDEIIEDEIRWTTDGLLETIYQESEVLYKACGDDGSPVGLIGWTSSPEGHTKRLKSMECMHNGCSVKSGAKQDAKLQKKNTHITSSLDITSWLGISGWLRAERTRVLGCYQATEIYRTLSLTWIILGPTHYSSLGITFMAVDPNHQRQGVGDMLMKIFCDYVDNNKLDSFVLSSPPGIRLYSKFGFTNVGGVETEQGSFTSMFRHKPPDQHGNATVKDKTS